MQTFKTYFRISKKYLQGFFIYVPIFFVIMMLMVNQQTEKTETKFSTSSIKISIFDHDHSTLSKSLADYLGEHHKLIDIKEDMDTIRDEIYQRNIDYILVIPEGYENYINACAQSPSAENTDSFTNDANTTDDRMLVTYKIPNSRFAAFADSQINKYMKIYSTYISAGADREEAATKTISTMSEETTVTIQASEKEAISYVHIFYTYMTYILISVVTLCISPILILFNENKIKSRLNVSSVSPLKINLQLALASLIYTFGITLLFILTSFVLFKDEMVFDKTILRIANAAVYALICLSLTFLLATCLAKQNMLSAIVNLIGLGQSFICGVFVDRALMSKVVLAFGRVFPAYWYVNIEEELNKYKHITDFTDSSRHTVIYGFIIEILFAVILFMIGLVINKNKKN